jgi:hypothetical protein
MKEWLQSGEFWRDVAVQVISGILVVLVIRWWKK